VRAFLRLAAAGVLDGTSFPPRGEGLRRADRLPEHARTADREDSRRSSAAAAGVQRHEARQGIVSMAHGDDPASATTSFFICTGDAARSTASTPPFGRVVDGMSVVEAIEQAPVNGETPLARIELKQVRVVK
jgi:cyclophilin family peptidyl-prolyl cis-trans isomerase